MQISHFAQRLALSGARPDRAGAFHARDDDRLAGHLSARCCCRSSRQGSQKN